MENTPSHTRSPYNTMVREKGDILAKAILSKPAGYISPSGKGVYFLPECTTEAQALAFFYEAKGPKIATLKPGERGEPVSKSELSMIRHITLAAAKAISRMSGGCARGRIIILDDRFAKWESAAGCEFKDDFAGAILAYCQETGERIERRELERTKAPVSREAVEAYRAGFSNAIFVYGTTSAFENAEAITKQAVAEWVAKQEGR